ncbi:transcription factor IIIB 90 kDa subunit-like [Oscarella lobularis]|uniref:transcription factor IIIB 90 kDa subunit-like n=1 Tax=Oscarella lobularis TaxID=121494 RepID=UPI003313B40F
MASVCTVCGGTEIDYDQARGDVVCTSCGSVLEDNIIVSEVNFQETSAGGSAVVGQFVSADEGAASARLGSGGFSRGFNRESREITLQNGHKRISALGRQLQLNKRCIETAYNFFKMAVGKRLTQGRKSNHVAAACLYLVCRTEGTPHLLLDFSDTLQVNVYVLGRCYLKLANALCISAPAIDPCLYVHRFAHKLEFGEKTHDVAMTALRLVSRMKRDWIHHGRRPSGLCGAALLVSARLHNFSRTIRDIIRVVRICEPTLRKRLEEFEKTPSGQLTIDEFLKIDLEEESDPPSFTKSRKKAKSQSDKAKDTADSEQRQQLAEITLAESEINQLLESYGTDDDVDLTDASKMVTFSDSVDVIEFVQQKPQEEENREERRRDDAAEIRSALTHTAMSGGPSIEAAGGGDVLAAAMGNDVVSIPDLVASLTGEDNAVDENEAGIEGELLDDLDDDELDRLILAPEEVEVKTKMWMVENADYLAEQEEKRKREELEKEKNKDKPPKKPRKKRKPKAPMKPCKTAGEAIEHMLQAKRISNKINYEVLKDLTSTRSSVVQPLANTALTSWAFEREEEESGETDSSASKRPRAEGGDVPVETGPVERDDEPNASDDDKEDAADVGPSAAELFGRDVTEDDEVY